MKNYFISPDGIDYRPSSISTLTNRSDTHHYRYIEFFNAESLERVGECLSLADLYQIRKGHMFLILANTHEAFHDVVAPIYEHVIKGLNLPPMQVILMSESAIIHTEVKSVASAYDLPEINVEWSRIFELTLKINEPPTVMTLTNKHYEKKFLNLNRRWRTHRPVFIALLKAHGLLDKGYVSFAPNVDNRNWNNTWDNTVNLEPSLAPYKDDIVNMQPLYLDTNELHVNQVELTTSTDQYYADTYFSVVSETNFYEQWGKGLFASEKTFKPMKMLHPFILLNRPHALSALKSIGYETFSDIIDESYDSEGNDQKRMMMVLEETKRLASLTPDEVTDFVTRAKSICMHNFITLNNKTDWVTRL